MKNNAPKPIKRKLLNAYFVSTLSITLVLLLIGLLSLTVVNAKYLNNYIRENIGLTLVLDDEVREVDLLKLQKLLSAQPEVKSANYVEAETAANLLKEELGEDFVNFLGYNPLHATIDIKLYADYTKADSLINLEQKFLEFSNVEEVYYQKNLVALINENTNKISLFLIGLSIVMLLIFTALINNTIRLSVYSKRFIIHTMQLVGATRNFIRKPFVIQSIYQGIIGATLANAVLFTLIYYYQNQFQELINLSSNGLAPMVYGIVFLSGIIISALSTTLAVNKFLRMRYDELFN